jgi:hypothetical protein
VEFHLRGLTLTLRIPLGFQPQSEALPKLNTAVPAVIVAAELIWRCMFLPGPGDDLDTTLRNLRFVSEDYRGQASRAPLLPLQEDCDRALKRWLEKVQQYKARQQGVERSALEPSSSTREAWLRAAVAASEALHFLLQVAGVIQLEGQRGERHRSQPVAALKSATDAAGVVSLLRTCGSPNILKQRLWSFAMQSVRRMLTPPCVIAPR